MATFAELLNGRIDEALAARANYAPVPLSDIEDWAREIDERCRFSESVERGERYSMVAFSDQSEVAFSAE